jgi:hypothetical protein
LKLDIELIVPRSVVILKDKIFLVILNFIDEGLSLSEERNPKVRFDVPEE